MGIAKIRRGTRSYVDYANTYIHTYINITYCFLFQVIYLFIYCIFQFLCSIVFDFMVFDSYQTKSTYDSFRFGGFLLILVWFFIFSLRAGRMLGLVRIVVVIVYIRFYSFDLIINSRHERMNWLVRRRIIVIVIIIIVESSSSRTINYGFVIPIIDMLLLLLL